MLLISSCGTESEQVENLRVSDLPAVKPQQLIEIESAGDHFFNHIGYHSIPLADGSFLLPDRPQSTLYHLSDEGALLSIASPEGRGPGEVEDPLFLTLSADGTSMMYDQGNRKVLKFDDQGSFSEEFITPTGETSNISEVYYLDNNYLTVFKSFEYITDPDTDPKAYLSILNQEQDEYTYSRQIRDRAHARNIVDGQPRGARQVPFAPEHLRAFNPKNKTVSLFWSGGDKIAKVNADLDTISTITVDVQPERLNQEERNRIREETGDNMWPEMEDLLPETKAIADDMIIDHLGRHWLHLNHRSEFEQWLILSEEGEPEAVIQLPENAMLTHVSEHHLGVRLDDHFFALFEPINDVEPSL